MKLSLYCLWACNILATRFASESRLKVVLMLGSLSHSCALWPVPLHAWHMILSIYNCCSSSSSGPSFVTCFWYLQPGLLIFVLPQHHHIVPPHSDRWVQHDQLKFSLWLYSLWQLMQTFFDMSIVLLFRNFEIFMFDFYSSYYSMLIVFYAFSKFSKVSCFTSLFFACSYSRCSILAAIVLSCFLLFSRNF